MAGESDERQAEVRAPRQSGKARRAAGAAARGLHHVLHVIFAVAVVAVLAAGLVWLRLERGPVHIPFAAATVERLFNQGSERLRVHVGDVVLTLGERGAPAGVQFVDVRLSYVSGEPLFVIPRLAARFDVADLLRGRLRPIRVTLIRPEARLVRTADGAFRFGLGDVAQGDQPNLSGAVRGPAQRAAIARLMDELAGDAPSIPELSRLEEVAIRNAHLVFDNARAGRRWTTRRADLSVWRTQGGLRARADLDLADAGKAGARAVITAVRPRGKGGLARIEARFENLRPEHLAEQLEQVKWLSLFDARLNGRLAMTLYPDGRIEGLEGRISAGKGRILALGAEGKPFDSVTLAFAYEPGRERMRVTDFSLTGPAAEARLSGFADLLRGPDGEVTGLAGQFHVAKLRAEVPEVFAQPVAFDDGQIVARLDLAPLRIEVANSHLRAGALVVQVEGEARSGPGGWQTDVRAAGQHMSIAQLVQFWPHVAAGNARRWVVKNMGTGQIDSFVAHMRFAGGEPQVNLDFTYSGLESHYLGDMTPIVAASGRGSLTLHDFSLIMDSGEVRAVKGAPVALDGSVLSIPNLDTKRVMAEITLRGHGPTASVLTLIDEAPLRLTGKLGLDPASVGGTADVTAHLSFPLINDLTLNMVAAKTEAELTKLALPFRLPGGHLANVRADHVGLRASTQKMQVTGPIQVDGTPLNLDWTEYFDRGRDHRDIALEGSVTPAFLQTLKLGSEYFAGGKAAVKVTLSQSGSPDFNFKLEADLAPALLKVDSFNWRKAPGGAGHLNAEGTFGKDGIQVPKFDLETDELKAQGAITFGSDGRMQSAQVGRLRFRGLADVSLTAARKRDTLALAVGGRRLDLALFEGEGGGGDVGPGAADKSLTPLDVTFDLKELDITPKFIARPASGTYARTADGHAKANLEGTLSVPFTATYDKTAGEPASVVVSSSDAGALLRAAGLFGGAVGGQLRLKARLHPKQGTDMIGVAKIRDVRVHTGGTFRSILAKGGAKEAAAAAESGGLAFDKVEVPFEYRAGVMDLGQSIAKGDMLAIKVEGTVNEKSDAVDLVGVISPAYGLTGVLDNIPLLGTILSGGKGEGILAMTFNVKGTLDKPKFSVNPLSLLAPGILRSIFSGRTSKPDQRFLDQLRREPD